MEAGPSFLISQHALSAVGDIFRFALEIAPIQYRCMVVVNVKVMGQRLDDAMLRSAQVSSGK